MKCPRCGTEMVWMGNVQIEIKDLDKFEIWGVDWDHGDVFCPNYLKCGNHPAIKAQKESKS